MSLKIQPTIGMPMLYWPSKIERQGEVPVGQHRMPMLSCHSGEPFHAVVSYVWSWYVVNLAVTDHCGRVHDLTSVPLDQPGTETIPMGIETGRAHFDAKTIKQAEQDVLNQSRNDALHAAPAGPGPDPKDEPSTADAAAGEHLKALAAVGRQLGKQSLAQMLTEVFGALGEVCDCVECQAERRQKAQGEATAPKVYDDDVQNAIAEEHYFTAEDGVIGSNFSAHVKQIEGNGRSPSLFKVEGMDELAHVTFCVLILKNGFRVIGVNAGPVSAETVDAEYGRKLARHNAEEQIWPLLGFLLSDRLATPDQPTPV